MLSKLELLSAETNRGPWNHCGRKWYLVTDWSQVIWEGWPQWMLIASVAIWPGRPRKVLYIWQRKLGVFIRAATQTNWKHTQSHLMLEILYTWSGLVGFEWVFQYLIWLNKKKKKLSFLKIMSFAFLIVSIKT